jgi:hypothetical protein
MGCYNYSSSLFNPVSDEEFRKERLLKERKEKIEEILGIKKKKRL